MVPPLPCLVLRGPTALALRLLMNQSAPLVVEDSIALEWDLKSLLEAARSVSTVEWELSLQYDHSFFCISLTWR